MASPPTFVASQQMPKLSHSVSRGSTTTTSDSSRLGTAKPYNNSKPLKYARPQDLPSHPIVGVDLSASNAAALLSRNAKSKTMWKPTSTSPTAASAATLAQASSRSPEIWRPDPNSAAHLASILQRDPKYTITSATGTSSVSRSSSTSSRPSRMSTAAAQTQLNRSASQSGVQTQPLSSRMSAAAAQTQLNRSASQFGGQTPPLSPRMEALGAGKAAMAQQPPSSMPQLHTELHRQMSRGAAPPSPPSETVDSNAAGAAGAALYRGNSGYAESHGITSSQLRSLAVLEEAAKRAANERLSQIGVARPTYVMPASAHGPSQRPVTALGGAESASRRVQVEHQQKLERERYDLENGKYDAAARHEILMSAAQRNVNDSLTKIDKHISENRLFSNKELNAIALRAAEEEILGKHTANIGKVHIGNGVHMTMEEVEAVAKARVQPVLDELSEKALDQREKDEIERQERERLKEEKAAEKARIKEEKAVEKARIKEEKAKIKEDKARVKKEKAAEKAAEKTKRKADKKALAAADGSVTALESSQVGANAQTEIVDIPSADVSEDTEITERPSADVTALTEPEEELPVETELEKEPALKESLPAEPDFETEPVESKYMETLPFETEPVEPAELPAEVLTGKPVYEEPEYVDSLEPDIANSTGPEVWNEANGGAEAETVAPVQISETTDSESVRAAAIPLSDTPEIESADAVDVVDSDVLETHEIQGAVKAVVVGRGVAQVV
ncbi:hypothetical protein V1512DRAFT_21859 [Lipomyces arxii]|uniref:uncharacterized protein n=1 Tax=Lipomyces arxii TaxID=56418 RepID=UPI0034CFAED5